MSKTNLTEEFINGWKDFEKRLNGSAQLPVHKTRLSALESFKQLGIPGPKHEEYKFTNLGKALDKTFDFSKVPTTSGITEETVNKFTLKTLDANKLVFVNGKLDHELSNVISPKDQLVIKDLSTAFQEDTEILEQNFAKYADYKQDGFIALNTAYAQNGCFIHVPKGKIVDKPIALYFINDAIKGQSYSNIRNIFLVEDNSEVTFMEDFNTEGSHESLNNIVTEIVVNENAGVEYYKVQNNKNTAYHIGTTQVYQKRSSRFNAYTFTLNGAMIRNNLNVAIDAEGCESHMYGLYLLNGNTHVDNHTAVDHMKPHSFSNELYKGILEDSSRGVFNGKVFVRQDAQKTNAFQSNKNILLSDSSVMNSKPQLEIWADDVKCSHGCTTGQLDEDALFYLRARGLSKERARALLLYAFAIEVLENVKLEPLKTYLEELISERLRKDF